MPLVLRPTIKEFNREELEQHVSAIRERRMLLAFDYHTTTQLELEASQNRAERRYGEENARLGRELEALDRAIEKVETRIEKMVTLYQEHEQLEQLLEQHNAKVKS